MAECLGFLVDWDTRPEEPQAGYKFPSDCLGLHFRQRVMVNVVESSKALAADENAQLRSCAIKMGISASLTGRFAIIKELVPTTETRLRVIPASIPSEHDMNEI